MEFALLSVPQLSAPIVLSNIVIMFGKKIFSSKKIPAALSFISKGTKLSGNIEFVGDVLIGGHVNGQIHSQGNIIVEQDGRIEGEIKCQEFTIDGFFKGRLICERLVIHSNGVVDGDVASTSMQIMEGGQFIGLRIREDISTIKTHNLTSPNEKGIQLTSEQLKTDNS